MYYTDIGIAKRILGPNFFGPAEIKKAFGIKPATVPAIPFTCAELDKASREGMYLILRINRLPKQDLTASNINEHFEDSPDFGRIFYDISLYNREYFFDRQVSSFSWRLVSQDVIPETIGVNYIDQTRAVLNRVFSFYWNCPMPELLIRAKEQFDSKMQRLEDVYSEDQKRACFEASMLGANQLYRETFVDLVYDIVVWYTINRRRLLPKTCVITNSYTSKKEMVIAGKYTTSGIIVSPNSFILGDSDHSWGVRLSIGGN